MHTLFAILSFLILVFGIILIIFATALLDWYLKVWKSHIDENVSRHVLYENTVITGSVLIVVGFVGLLIIELFSQKFIHKREKHRYITTHMKRQSKRKSKGNIIDIVKKTSTGPMGGKYYTRKNRKGKSVKVYIK